MGLTVVPARLKDTTPEIHMAAPMRAGPTEERRYAGNIKSKEGAADEAHHISAATIKQTATGGSFNQRLSQNTKPNETQPSSKGARNTCIGHFCPTKRKGSELRAAWPRTSRSMRPAHVQDLPARLHKQTRRPVIPQHLDRNTTASQPGWQELNEAFHWPKRRTRVWLYDGVGEPDLGSVADVYAASGTDRIYTVASAESVVARHGLQVCDALAGAERSRNGSTAGTRRRRPRAAGESCSR